MIDIQSPTAEIRRGKKERTRMGPAFPASRVQHVSDLHMKFALRPHYVWKYMADVQSATAEIRREKRKKKKKEEETTRQKITVCPITVCLGSVLRQRTREIS